MKRRTIPSVFPATKHPTPQIRANAPESRSSVSGSYFPGYTPKTRNKKPTQKAMPRARNAFQARNGKKKRNTSTIRMITNHFSR